MHSPFRTRGLIPTLTLALALAVTLPGLAAAKPEPGYQQRGFRLLAGAIGAMQINRVFCGLSSLGQICVNAAGCFGSPRMRTPISRRFSSINSPICGRR